MDNITNRLEDLIKEKGNLSVDFIANAIIGKPLDFSHEDYEKYGELFWGYENRLKNISFLLEEGKVNISSREDLEKIEQALGELDARSRDKKNHLYKSLHNEKRAGLKERFEEFKSDLSQYILNKKNELNCAIKDYQSPLNLEQKSIRADAIPSLKTTNNPKNCRALERSAFRENIRYILQKNKIKLTKLKEKLKNAKEEALAGFWDFFHPVPKPVVTGLGILAAIVTGATIRAVIPKKPVLPKAEARETQRIEERYQIPSLQIPQPLYPELSEKKFGVASKREIEQEPKTIKEEIRDEISQAFTGMKKPDFRNGIGSTNRRLFYSNNAGDIEALTRHDPFAYYKIIDIKDSAGNYFDVLVRGGVIRLFGNKKNIDLSNTLYVTELDGKSIGITHRRPGYVTIRRRGYEDEIRKIPEIPEILRCNS